jgi:prepilin-type N-terminal cleavage/methylation domain-containing protein
MRIVPRRARGFTLVELIVVIAIVLIVVALLAMALRALLRVVRSFGPLDRVALKASNLGSAARVALAGSMEQGGGPMAVGSALGALGAGRDEKSLSCGRHDHEHRLHAYTLPASRWNS